MPLFSELDDYLDPTREDARRYTRQEADMESPYAGSDAPEGPYVRESLDVEDEVGRRVIQEVQPGILQPPIKDGLPNVHGFLSNLGENVEDFAKGTFAMLSYPVRHPQETAELATHPVDTGTKFAQAMYDSYKTNYTPNPDETVPQMLMRRFYEKPFDTLMDASMIGQVAFGGLGLGVRAATAGTRATAAGGAAAEAIAKGSGFAALAAVPADYLQVERAAAKASKTIDFLDAQTARAKLLDPISLAINTGDKILTRFTPEVAAGLHARTRVTDGLAERTAIMSAAEAKHRTDVQGAFGHLNDAERAVIWPYISGRVNFERPVSEQLMTHTGEWVPLKGDSIRPDALELARQTYIPLQQELEYMRELTPAQVELTATKKAFVDAQEIMGDDFDPMHSDVQSFITDSVKEALVENAEHQKRIATGEMRTSLDAAKETKYRAQIEDMVKSNMWATAKQAEAGLPRPTRTTVEEAVALMGPQGGMYFPHSAEVYTREQSTIKNVLDRMGEANTWKENTYALYESGVMEHNDPINQLLRAYTSLEKGKSWLHIGYEMAEEATKKGEATRMVAKGKDAWNWKTDPDVIAGTHQPFHPGMMMTEDLVAEHGQRTIMRLMEAAAGSPSRAMHAGEMTIDAVTAPKGIHPSNAAGPFAQGGLPGATEAGQVNMADLMHTMIQEADKGVLYKYRKEIPLYKIQTSMEHAIKSMQDAMEPSTNGVIRKIDSLTQWWNMTNLNVRMARLINNIGGNLGFAAMQGLHPFTPRGIVALGNIGIAIGAKSGLLKGERAQKLAKVFDLPGVRSGGLQLNLTQQTGTTTHTLQTAGLQAGRAGKLATLPVRTLGHWASIMQNVNGQIETAFRGASLFYELGDDVITRAKRMTGHMGAAMDLGEQIDRFASNGAAITMKVPEYRAALRQVNRYYNNYERTSPMERMMWRRLTPYYKFFKHATDLITRYPFEHPLKGQVARQLGQLAVQDMHDELSRYGLKWNRDVAAQFQDSIPVSADIDPDTGKHRVWTYSTKGINPFAQMDGHLSEQMVQMLNPVIKVALEQQLGVNLFTRTRYMGAMSSYTGKEIDPKYGGVTDSFERPSFAESFLRSFWPYEAVRNLVANGRVPTDTASLLQMVQDGPEAWQLDNESGYVRRQPTSSRFSALGRFVGPIPRAIVEPDDEALASRKGITNTQLNTLYQRYPQHRAKIEEAIARHEAAVDAEPEPEDY